MPDISKFKSVSVSTDTHDKLMSMAEKRFEVPVSVQKVIEFLIEKELKKNLFDPKADEIRLELTYKDQFDNKSLSQRLKHQSG